MDAENRDLIQALEHDHTRMTTLVDELSDRLGSSDEEDSPEQLEGQWAACSDAVDALREELLEHFGREEECVFPFVVEALPDLATQVETLATAHDTLCGTLARMAYLLARGEEQLTSHLPQLRSSFERFEFAYELHSRNECLLLREVSRRLDETQRLALIECARGVF